MKKTERHQMKKLIWILVCLSGQILAQNKDQKWQLNAGASGHIFHDGVGGITDNLTALDRMNFAVPLNHLSLARHLGGGFSPELKFTANKFALNPNATSIKTMMANGMFNLKYSLANGYLLKTTSFIEPYLKGGAGMTWMDQLDNDKFLTTYAFGGGLAFWINKSKNFGFQIQQMYHMIPMYPFSNNNRDYFEYSGTLNYRFGMKDRDKDGIADDKDECPDDKGLKALKGCPDRDGDGIPDKSDRCPDDKGPKEFEGCPDRDLDSVPDIDDKCPDIKGLIFLMGCPDADLDSIPDYQDSCPNIKGLKQFKGCPDRDRDNIEDRQDDCPDVPGLPQYKGCPDTDGDGLPDNQDNCPNEAGPKRNFGCPEEVNKDSINKKLAFHAKSIFFTVNKHDILPTSFPVLDEIVTIIREYPNERFVVEGHADISGKEDKNLTLSKNRANAVMEYLISNGVPRTSIEAAGFGIKYPLSDNKSKLGRAQNRRVDVTVKR